MVFWFWVFGWLFLLLLGLLVLFFPNLRHSLDLPEINWYLNREFSIETFPS